MRKSLFLPLVVASSRSFWSFVVIFTLSARCVAGSVKGNETLRTQASDLNLNGSLRYPTFNDRRRLVEVRSQTGAKFDVSRAPAPLFRDPLYDGAADPTVIWDERRKEWRIFYTQRRAKGSEDLPGVSWAYGTAIAMATSSDFGATWRYQGTCKGLDFESGLNTFWAPDVVRGGDGSWHMHVTYVRRVRLTWGGKQMLAHLTSSGDLGSWTFKGFVEVQDDRQREGALALTGAQRVLDTTAAQALGVDGGSTELLTKVIDADVRLLPDGRWKIWYKDLKVHGGGTTMSATTRDPHMGSWTRSREVEVEDTPAHEAPVVFEWKGFFWLVVDPLNEEGLRAYRSTDASHWSTQPHKLLVEGGRRKDDGHGGSHADVVVTMDDDRAYIFYFVHPVKEKKNAKPSTATRRTSLQVAELEFDGRWLNCDRDRYANSGGGSSGSGGGVQRDQNMQQQQQQQLQSLEATKAAALAAKKAGLGPRSVLRQQQLQQQLQLEASAESTPSSFDSTTPVVLASQGSRREGRERGGGLGGLKKHAGQAKLRGQEVRSGGGGGAYAAWKQSQKQQRGGGQSDDHPGAAEGAAGGGGGGAGVAQQATTSLHSPVSVAASWWSSSAESPFIKPGPGR